MKVFLFSIYYSCTKLQKLHIATYTFLKVTKKDHQKSKLFNTVCLCVLLHFILIIKVLITKPMYVMLKILPFCLRYWRACPTGPQERARHHLHEKRRPLLLHQMPFLLLVPLMQHAILYPACNSFYLFTLKENIVSELGLKAILK